MIFGAKANNLCAGSGGVEWENRVPSRRPDKTHRTPDGERARDGVILDGVSRISVPGDRSYSLHAELVFSID